MKKISILGSTGSIGTQTLDIVRNNDDLQVVMEPTGIYSLPLATWLYKKHIKIFMVNPYKAKHYALSEGNGSKNDIIDARMLASYGETHQLVAWVPKSEIVIKLDYLLSRIGQLVDMRTQEKNHLEKGDFKSKNRWDRTSHRSLLTTLETLLFDIFSSFAISTWLCFPLKYFSKIISFI